MGIKVPGGGSYGVRQEVFSVPETIEVDDSPTSERKGSGLVSGLPPPTPREN